MRLMVRSPIKSPITALDDVDLDVGPGEICAVVGPNGAGKTTMFRILIGLTTPTSGAAVVDGLDADRQSDQVRRRIGWMPAEDRSLFMRLSCVENLRFHGRLQGLGKVELERRIPAMLDQVGLGARMDSSIVSLSAGMRARVQLARALLNRPRLIILDEPTGAVDPVGAHQLLELVIGLVRSHDLAALISSHRLEEIEALHSKVILLDRGAVRYMGDLDALRMQWDRPSLALEFSSEGAAAGALALLDESRYEARLAGAALVCHPTRDVTVGEILQRIAPLTAELRHIREGAIPLRDLLARMYGAQRPALAAAGSQP